MTVNFVFKTSIRLLFVSIIFLSAMNIAKAQYGRNEYMVQEGIVSYRGEPMLMADPSSFIELGYGYAKDYFNVYLDGAVLRYVDPATFRLRPSGYGEYDGYYPDMRGSAMRYGYVKTSYSVLFNGKKVEDAMPSTFRDLGAGYALDTFNVYFMGRKIDAMSSTFRYLGSGYAADTFNAYYMGRKIDDVMVSTFKIIGDGYAEDAFNTYYRGRKADN